MKKPGFLFGDNRGKIESAGFGARLRRAEAGSLNPAFELEHSALLRFRKLAKSWIPALRARLPAKSGDPRKGCGRDRKSVPQTPARAPAGMTGRLKIRGPGEPRKPKAGTPERNKKRLKNYPPLLGIFITPVSIVAWIPVSASSFRNDGVGWPTL